MGRYKDPDYLKKWYQRNKEKQRIYRARYYQENKEKILSNNKDYIKKNKLRVAKRKRAYAIRNKDKIKKYMTNYWQKNRNSLTVKTKEWYENNKSRVLKLHYDWRRNNPEKQRNMITTQRARRRGWRGNATVSVREWKDLLFIHGGRCAYCGATKNIQQDHIVPLSKGGEHNIKNILPACRSCNSSKNNKNLCNWLMAVDMNRLKRKLAYA